MIRSLLRRVFDDDTLARLVLGVPVEDWVLLAAAFAVTALMAGARALMGWWLHSDARRPLSWIERVVADVLERTRGYFLFALALYLAARIVSWDALGLGWTAGLLTFAALLQSGRWITGVITLWIARYKAEKLAADASAVTSMQAVGLVSKIAVWSVISLMLLDNLGVDVTALVAGLGIGGIAIGLAAQNVLGDLFASLSIVIDKPFVIGDTLTVGADSGTVERIGLKSTRLRSISGEQIVFSNGDLLASRVRNFERMTERRVVLTLGVEYDTDVDALASIPDLVQRAVEAVGADPEGAPLRFDRAHVRGLSASSVDVEAVYHVLDPDYGRYMDAQQRITLAVLSALREREVALAFPTRTVHVASAPALGAPPVSEPPLIA